MRIFSNQNVLLDVISRIILPTNTISSIFFTQNKNESNEYTLVSRKRDRKFRKTGNNKYECNVSEKREA